MFDELLLIDFSPAPDTCTPKADTAYPSQIKPSKSRPHKASGGHARSLQALGRASCSKASF